MTIKEVEEKTGLARSNIRFYEKEKLIQPFRNENNGYREYTEQDVQDIKKIAYLRTLGISIENIHKIIQHQIALKEVINVQEKSLDEQIIDLEKAKNICQMMMEDSELTYDNLDIEIYVPKLTEYWETNKKVLRMDSVSFIYMWSGTLVWIIMTGICLAVALLSYPGLPEQIPIQYSGGEASSTVKKIFIFAYPLFCVIIRLFFRIYFRWKLRISNQKINDLVSDYLTNCLSFVVLSAEIFSVLFINGYVKNVVLMLLIDGVVLGGTLIMGITKLSIYESDGE